MFSFKQLSIASLSLAGLLVAALSSDAGSCQSGFRGGYAPRYQPAYAYPVYQPIYYPTYAPACQYPFQQNVPAGVVEPGFNGGVAPINANLPPAGPLGAAPVSAPVAPLAAGVPVGGAAVAPGAPNLPPPGPLPAPVDAGQPVVAPNAGPLPAVSPIPAAPVGVVPQGGPLVVPQNPQAPRIEGFSSLPGNVDGITAYNVGAQGR